MKLIVAIVRPEKLAAVQAALDQRDVHLMTVSEVLDCDRQQASTEIYRGREFRRPASKLRVEIAVDDLCLESTVDALVRAGQAADSSGATDDGRVFVMGLEERVRMRPGESSWAALN